MATQFKAGTVTGTGSAINVELGFEPAMVILVNETDAGVAIWTNTMAAAKGAKLTDTPALSFMSANGISAYAGASGSTGKGFTIGADADLNAASDVLHYVAIGQD